CPKRATDPRHLYTAKKFGCYQVLPAHATQAKQKVGKIGRCAMAFSVAIDPRFLRAEELGIRLEIVGGLPIWEAHPVWRHQKAIDRIRATIRATKRATDAGCECVHVSDVY